MTRVVRSNGAMARFGAAALLLCAMPAIARASGPASGPTCPTVAPRHVDLPATRAALASGRPLTIVAFGSSSTEGAGASEPERAYPARLAVFLREHWRRAAVTVLNRGIGGQTIEPMVARLEADVLSQNPTLVIWQAGANDAMRAADTARFGALLDEGVRRIAASGSDLILMDNQIAPRLPTTPAFAVYGTLLARAAVARSVSLFSRTALMRDWGSTDASAAEMIGKDGLHHTDLGYACLAESLGQAITAAMAPPSMHAGQPRPAR